MDKMFIVSLSVACEPKEADQILKDMADSHIAQIGIYCIGQDVRNATKEEVEMVKEQLLKSLDDEDL